ncbi:hypothetical protein FJZ19_01630 [Candidatus Pacearchaeota archaeon]|nr:hypothetical protein [Candidatus Pacearchaeota archaeon]
MADQTYDTKNIGLLDRLVCERVKGHPLNEQLKEQGKRNSIDRLFGIVALVSGATAGFLDGFGINAPLVADLSMKIAPTVLQSGAEYLVGSFTMASVERYSESALPFAARGAVLGAGKTAVGYCIGFTAANLVKKYL